MVQSTQNNYCEFGFNESSFTTRRTLQDKFFVKYAPCTRNSLSWKDECIRAAQDIYSWAQLDLRVCMSGGIDSEIVAESFRLAGLKFRAVIMRFNHDLI